VTRLKQKRRSRFGSPLAPVAQIAINFAFVLLSYRVHGGPVRVDQRLTVSEDGQVELDERHRSRDPVRLEIGSTELERIRELLATVSDRRMGVGEWLAHHLSQGKGPRFRLDWGGHKITAADPADPNLAELLSVLEELRVRAIRSQPR
jgi:hypothetical protein